MWLRQISKYVERTSNVCLTIVGHASRTGAADYNKTLSAKRAKQVQSFLGQTYPGIVKRSEAIGMGFEKNIVGTGIDSAQDAIDRRVEFTLRACQSA